MAETLSKEAISNILDTANSEENSAEVDVVDGSAENAPVGRSEDSEVGAQDDAGDGKEDLYGETETRSREFLEAFRAEEDTEGSQEIQGIQLPKWLRGPTEAEKEAAKQVIEESAEKVRENVARLTNKYNSIMDKIRASVEARGTAQGQSSTQRGVSYLGQAGRQAAQEEAPEAPEEVSSLVDQETPELEVNEQEADQPTTLPEVQETVQQETFKGPSHSEIMEVYKHGTQEMCTEIAVESMRDVMENLGYTREINGEMEYSLTNARRFEGGGLPESTGDGPEVYFKHVKGTNEVVVVARLNNGSSESDSTVVVINANLDTRKNRQGLINWDAPRLHIVVSEERYNYFAVEEPKSLKGKLHNGEYTIKEYKDRYRKKNRLLPFGKGGETLGEYWKKRDKQVGRTQEGWRAIENKEALLTDLREAYVRTLVEKADGTTQIIDETEKKKKALEKMRKEKELAKEFFVQLGGLSEIGLIGDAVFENFKEGYAETFGMSVKDMEGAYEEARIRGENI